MGLVVIKSILFTVDSPAMLENEYYVQEKIKTDVQYVIQCIKNKKIIQASEEQSLYYYNFREYILKGGISLKQRVLGEK